MNQPLFGTQLFQLDSPERMDGQEPLIALDDFLQARCAWGRGLEESNPDTD